ncbi:hypothetical protein G9A89_020673 [Geosiphon pyriformis]|nr:hypothetical protein G9A89_020673 [Geosiphon pyriformis]
MLVSKSLKSAGSKEVADGAAAYFPAVDTDIGIRRYLVAEKTVMFGNARYFVHDLYQSICYVYWEAGLGFDIISGILVNKIE